MALSIVKTEDVIERMGLPDVDGVSIAIESALTAATARFQALLDTSFNKESRADLFYLKAKQFPIIENGYFNLRLRKMFLTNGTIIVTAANSITDLGQTIDQPDWMVDKAKGLIFIHASYVDKYIKVVYEAGFDTLNTPPSWLKESILAYMPYLLNSQQSSNRNSESGEVTKRTSDLSAIMVEPYMRGFAFQYRPMF